MEDSYLKKTSSLTKEGNDNEYHQEFNAIRLDEERKKLLKKEEAEETYSRREYPTRYDERNDNASPGSITFFGRKKKRQERHARPIKRK